MISISEVESEIAQGVASKFHGKSIRIIDDEEPRNFCIINERVTKENLERIHSMKVYEDDVWIVTYPKCGTTLMQEMKFREYPLIMNDFNFEKALQVDLDKRMPFLEYEALLDEAPFAYPRTIQIAQDMPRPRIIKTHLPAFLLPKELFVVKPRIIYVARNPKDAAISWYHQHVNLHGWIEANLNLFIEAFTKDLMLYSPFNNHVLKFWEMRNESNVFFVHFEDMIKDKRSVIKSVESFLGKLISLQNFEKLCEHLSFDKMRENKAVNYAELIERTSKGQDRKFNWNFIRKGKVGSHKEELTEVHLEMLDDYVREFEARTDFRYKFK